MWSTLMIAWPRHPVNQPLQALPGTSAQQAAAHVWPDLRHCCCSLPHVPKCFSGSHWKVAHLRSTPECTLPVCYRLLDICIHPLREHFHKVDMTWLACVCLDLPA